MYLNPGESKTVRFALIEKGLGIRHDPYGRNGAKTSYGFELKMELPVSGKVVLPDGSVGILHEGKDQTFI